MPFAAGGTVACADSLAFTFRGVGLSSRTIEGDFAFVWGPTGGVRWGEFPGLSRYRIGLYSSLVRSDPSLATTAQ